MTQSNPNITKRIFDMMLDNHISFADLLTYAYNSNYVSISKYKKILEIIDGTR